MSAATTASLPPLALTNQRRPRRSILPCTNTRHTYAACSHVYLARCSVHGVDEDSGSCVCPDPRASFVAIEHPRPCPSCDLEARQKEYDTNLAALLDRQKPISTSIAQYYAARLKLPRLYFSEDVKAEMDEKYVSEIRDLQEQSRQLTAEIKDVEANIARLPDDVAECEQWERIATWVQCQGKGKQRLMIWFTCEDDAELWKWDMHQ